LTEPAGSSPYHDYSIEDEPDDVDYALLGIEPPHKRAWQAAVPVGQIDPAVEARVDMLIAWADSWVEDLLLKPEHITDDFEQRDAQDRLFEATVALEKARLCPEDDPILHLSALLTGRTPKEALAGIEDCVRKRILPSQRLSGGRG
jgi:hypothetical protein